MTAHTKVLIKIQNGEVIKYFSITQGSVSERKDDLQEIKISADDDIEIADGWHYGTANYWRGILQDVRLARSSKTGPLKPSKEIKKWEKRTQAAAVRRNAPGVKGNQQIYNAAAASSLNRAYEAQQLVEVFTEAL